MNFLKDNNGYIALISVVIIVLILLGTTAALATSGFLNRFNILDGEAKEISAGYAHACIEAARIKFVRDDVITDIGTPINVGEGTCTITEANPSGTSVDIQVKGVHEHTGATTKYEVTISGDGSLSGLREF